MAVYVTGVQQVKRKLQALQGIVPSLLNREQLGDLLVRNMRKRFVDMTDPDGNKWAPSAPSTKNVQTLMRSRSLIKAIKVFNSAPGGRYALATGAGFRIGIASIRHTYGNAKRVNDTAQYGRYHQQGIGVTQRKFIGLSKADQRAVGDYVRRELRRAVNRV